MSPALRILQIDPEAERERVVAELCRRKFSRFVREAWPLIDPAPLVWNWHLDALCDHLQAVSEGKISKLLINIPPGHAKSNVVSVLWPVWHWGTRDPSWRVMTASYELGLATRDATKARELINTAWFQEHFTLDPRPRAPDDEEEPERWTLSDDQNVKTYYSNSALGFRLAMSVGGKGTGYRGDALVIDDPLNAKDAISALKRNEVIRWKTETMSSRFNDLERAVEVVIMQRLHEDDLAGYLLKAGGFVHLNLPSEYETPAKRRKTKGCVCATCEAGVTPIGWKDPRTKDGELLFPAKFSRKVLAEAKTAKGMGEVAFAGQHQQRPTPAGGNVLKRDWLRYRWHMPGADAPPFSEGTVRLAHDPLRVRPTQRLIVSDCAFKKTADSDRVAIGVWDLVGPNLFLIDLAWDRFGFLDTVREIARLREKWAKTPGRVGRVAIEDKANGPAVIEVLRAKVPGIVPIEPLGSKEARVSAGAPYFHAGNVYLPEGHEQLEAMIAEACAFPRGANDDWIDMASYAVLLTLAGSDLSRLEGLVRM